MNLCLHFSEFPLYLQSLYVQSLGFDIFFLLDYRPIKSGLYLIFYLISIRKCFYLFDVGVSKHLQIIYTRECFYLFNVGVSKHLQIIYIRECFYLFNVGISKHLQMLYKCEQQSGII